MPESILKAGYEHLLHCVVPATTLQGHEVLCESLFIVAVLLHNRAAKKAHNERTLHRRIVDRTVTEGDRILLILVTHCEQIFKDKPTHT